MDFLEFFSRFSFWIRDTDESNKMISSTSFNISLPVRFNEITNNIQNQNNKWAKEEKSGYKTTHKLVWNFWNRSARWKLLYVLLKLISEASWRECLKSNRFRFCKSEMPKWERYRYYISDWGGVCSILYIIWQLKCTSNDIQIFN